MSNNTVQRYSRQRECILQTLSGTTSHPTANWIYDNVRKEIPNISLGTVYRNLSKLCIEGLVLKIDVGDGTERYDACINPHYHLYCRNCGCVCDIMTDYARQLDKMAALENNCKIDYHNLVFCGLCSDCTSKIKNN